MIVARGTHEQKQLLILSLSKENIDRLLQGHPIHIRREVHGPGIPEGLEILLFSGKTEQEMHDLLKEAGWALWSHH